MRARLLGVTTVLAFLVSANVNAKATTIYTIQNPFGSVGNIWFPALTPSNVTNGGVGGVSGTIVTDGTLGPLSVLNIVNFQITVNALTSTNGWSSDITSPAWGGIGVSVTIDGTALFATPTGLFFDFGSISSSYVKFERDST